jgi:iron(III) transport system substrate-binding protein
MRWAAPLVLIEALALVSAGSAAAEELHVYTSLDPLDAEQYLRAFETESGVSVRWVRMSSGEVLTRIRAERSRPQASVWLGGSASEFALAASEGLLEANHPRSFDAFAAGTRDPSWRWVGVSTSPIGFASNPAVLKEQGASVPHAWKDLLAPGLRGLVSMAYAFTSGTAYTIIASHVFLMGEDGAERFWRALDQNVHHYNRSGSACVTQVGLGEIGTCVAFSNDILTKGVQKGYPVVLTFPEEGTAHEVNGIALLHDAPEDALGRRLIDFMLDVTAQRLFSKMNNVPIRPDVTGPELGAVSKPIEMDTDRAARERRHWVEMWREATGQ